MRIWTGSILRDGSGLHVRNIDWVDMVKHERPKKEEEIL
jgi:hypothetical protein